MKVQKLSQENVKMNIYTYTPGRILILEREVNGIYLYYSHGELWRPEKLLFHQGAHNIHYKFPNMCC